MAKNTVSDWSTNDALNTDIGGTNIAEGCAPSGINDAIRKLMAQIATWATTLMTKAGGVFTGGISGTTAAFSGAITQGGQQVWHAGNLNPAAYAALSGASFSGPVSSAGVVSGQALTSTSANLYLGTTGTRFLTLDGTYYALPGAELKVNGQQVWHSGNFNPANYAALGGASFTGAVSSTGIVSGQVLTTTAGTVYLGTTGTRFLTLDGTYYALPGADLKVNNNVVWHSGNFNPNAYASLAGAAFSGGVSAPAVSAPTVNLASGIAVVASGGRLQFLVGGAVIGSIDSGGTLRVSGNVIANTTP